MFFALVQTYAQNKRANNWNFGHGCFVSFATGAPVSDHGCPIYADEGCASISDSLGNLLFFTDGTTVWDRNSQVMPNGTDLMGNNTSTQSAIAIPRPGSNTQYYIITMDWGGSYNGLRYSLLDLTLNNGFGDITNEKNVQLPGYYFEKLTAVKNGNGKDYWIVALDFFTDSIKFFAVTAAGVNPTPVSSYVGVLAGANFTHNVGYMKFSPNARKLAFALWVKSAFDVVDFDPCTGKASNHISLYSPNFNQAYGVEFSPDSKLLYGSSIAGPSNIYQFDLSAGTPTQIVDSAVLIYRNFASYVIGDLQLGPDEKIYGATNLQSRLAAINFPAVRGTGCGFVEIAVTLEGVCGLGLPALIGGFFNPVTTASNATVPTCHDSVAFSLSNLSGVDSIQWNFADPGSGSANISTLSSPYHIFTGSGTYFTRAFIYGTCRIDTLIDTVVITAAPHVNLGTDTLYCGNFTRQLTTGVANTLWSTGATGPAITATTPGQYWAVATNNCGTGRDTINITTAPLPVVNLGADTAACSNNPILLNAATGGALYHWQDNSSQPTYTVTQTGNYSVTVSVGTCSSSDSIQVSLGSGILPVVNFGPDTVLCANQTLLLNATTPGATYRWQDNSVLPTYTVSQTGAYSVTVSVGPCSSSDSVLVTLSTANPPVVNLGPDTSICPNHSLLLNATTTGASYHWQDNSSQPTYTATQTGTYSVTVTVGVCNNHDSVHINLLSIQQPTVSTNADTICPSDSTLVCASGGYTSYHWNTGDTTRCIQVKNASNYYVTVSTNTGCSVESNHLGIVVYQSPAVSISRKEDTLSVYNAVHIQWYVNGHAINGATQSTYVARADGNYSVEITDDNGCSSFSIPFLYTGVADINNHENISIYPNPLSVGNFQLSVSNNLIGAQVEIIDNNGRLVYKTEIRNTHTEISTQIASGVYLLRITTGGNIAVRKLVKLYVCLQTKVNF